MGLTVAIAGDANINRRVSSCEDPGFHELVEAFTSADLGLVHLETLLHDYDDPRVYPAAEAGGTWMRAPPHVAEELAWMGIDLVTHASNHALDFSYGALESTWSHLSNAGIEWAGTGRSLAAAREPAYRESSGGRIGVVSMTSTFTPWGRAGEARRDLGGRPGVNPLRFHYAANEVTLDRIRTIAAAMGFWITPRSGGYELTPPGLHNSVTRIDEGDVDGIEPVLDERDREGNLRSVREADRQSDLVIAHIHSHEWDPDRTISHPSTFLPPFARDCVDNGADIVLCQGSHAPLRGIEVYGGAPIFYDPGDFFMMSDTVGRLPTEFYQDFDQQLDSHVSEAMPGEALSVRGLTDQFGDGDATSADYGGNVDHPSGGYFTGEVLGNFVGECHFDDGMALERIELHPGKLRFDSALYRGVPTIPSNAERRAIIEHVDWLSAEFGTDIEFRDGRGVIEG